MRVLRLITRLNIGGPAQHVLFLAEGMKEDFETTLVCGVPEDSEGDMTDLAKKLGVPVRVLPTLKRQPSFLNDLKTLWTLWRLCRELKPAIVHTHTAKAGALGRLAARLAGVPVVLHTFHGHVFRGYFPTWQSRLLVLAERLLGCLTTRIYALSPSQKDELTALGVAPASKIRVLPLGLDLASFAPPLPRGRLRASLALPEDAILIGCVARLVPIKNHLALLEAFSRVAPAQPKAHLVLIGDGPLRPAIEEMIAAHHLKGRVHLTGWRGDLPEVYGDLDLVVLASLNEGLPVCLIEAAAAGVPMLATRVGGVGDLLSRHPGAILIPPGDAEALFQGLAQALQRLPSMQTMVLAVTSDYRHRYEKTRLIGDLTREYRELL